MCSRSKRWWNMMIQYLCRSEGSLSTIFDCIESGQRTFHNFITAILHNAQSIYSLTEKTFSNYLQMHLIYINLHFPLKRQTTCTAHCLGGAPIKIESRIRNPPALVPRHFHFSPAHREIMCSLWNLRRFFNETLLPLERRFGLSSDTHSNAMPRHRWCQRRRCKNRPNHTITFLSFSWSDATVHERPRHFFLQKLRNADDQRVFSIAI